MNKLIWILAMMLAAPVTLAAGSAQLMHAHNDVSDIASLQRGARNFVNYCLGCHSAQYVRYNRVATDLGISESDLTQNLMWTADKPAETMQIAMPADDAARWFGRTPPDLSLTARSRGTDWVYTYLKSFYADDGAVFGFNNLLIPGLSMPNVLWEHEGSKQAVFEKTVDAKGNKHTAFSKFEPLTAGTMSAEEFDVFVTDIVNFMDYMSEPMKLKRQSLGIRVIAYLLVFFLLALALKKEYWKDVH